MFNFRFMAPPTKLEKNERLTVGIGRNKDWNVVKNTVLEEHRSPKRMKREENRMKVRETAGIA
jgi:peptidyl-tRNA hydrolase